MTHVDGKISPIDDIETIETELMLADLESLEKRATALEKKAKGGDKEAKESLDLMQRALVLLRDGKPARLVERKPEEERAFGMLGLMTAKPVLYVCNVEEASAKEGNSLSRRSLPAPPPRARRPWWSPPRSRARSRCCRRRSRRIILRPSTLRSRASTA